MIHVEFKLNTSWMNDHLMINEWLLNDYWMIIEWSLNDWWMRACLTLEQWEMKKIPITTISIWTQLSTNPSFLMQSSHQSSLITLDGANPDGRLIQKEGSVCRPNSADRTGNNFSSSSRISMKNTCRSHQIIRSKKTIHNNLAILIVFTRWSSIHFHSFVSWTPKGRCRSEGIVAIWLIIILW